MTSSLTMVNFHNHRDYGDMGGVDHLSEAGCVPSVDIATIGKCGVETKVTLCASPEKQQGVIQDHYSDATIFYVKELETSNFLALPGEHSHGMYFVKGGVNFVYQALQPSLKEGQSKDFYQEKFINCGNLPKIKNSERIISVVLTDDEYQTHKELIGIHQWEVIREEYTYGNQKFHNLFLIKTNAGSFFKRVKWEKVGTYDKNYKGALFVRRTEEWRKGRIVGTVVGVIALIAAAVLIALFAKK